MTSYVYVKELREQLTRAQLTVKCLAACLAVMTVAVALYLDYLQGLLQTAAAR